MNPYELLDKYWGYPEFRGSQLQIIQAVLNRRDVLALLPTGAGKSLCYQLPALAADGMCIVVSPLIALIQDQVASLKRKGIKALALTGGLPEEEVINLLDNCQFGNYKFLYLSPERLQQPMVQERISQLHVNLLAIDEAHCISQWGNDFRPAYLHCAVLRTLQPAAPVIALTATATKEVAAEIVENLGLSNSITFKDSFLRDNIAYQVLREEDKAYRLKHWCSREGGSGIVYVRTRRLAEEVSAMLHKSGSPSAFFHGGLSRKEKEDRLKGWMRSKPGIMVATNAFGMGVDKADVRWVVHYQIPESIENYFQEAGRAGRDGLPATALLLCNPADESQLKNQFLGTLPDIPFLKKLYKNLNNYFQISYGTGENSRYNFHFHEFCEAYKLNAILSYNGLQVLDQQSVIALSQNFKRKTRLQFVASKAQVWSYLEKNPTLAPTIQLLLRTYGGLFDYETKINTLLLSKKAGIPEDAVLNLLEKLHADGMVTYQAHHGDLDITFLVPREDDRTIHHFAPQVRKHQQVRSGKLRMMLQYVNDHKHCRTRQLLGYFGEKMPSDCGKCDVCLRRKRISRAGIKPVEAEILALLKEGSRSSRAIIAALDREEGHVLKALQLLLETGQIGITAKNEYTLN